MMKTTTATMLTALLVPAWVAAQAPAALNLNFPNFAAQAKEKAEVDLDESALAGARQLAGAKGDSAAAALSGVKGVHVRHYEFATEGAYSDADLNPLRQQVAASNAWSRIVDVKEPKESTQIYLMKGDSGPGGLLVINAESKELTVVEILGSVDLAHMQELVKSTIKYDLKAAAEQGQNNKQ